MILNDREITRLAKEHAMIEPFAEGAKRPGVISYGVTSFGYDMRVADEWMTREINAVLDPKQDDIDSWLWWQKDTQILQPGCFYLCRSVEYFRMPEDVLGVVVGKSTYARCGLIVNVTPLEPTWEGYLTLEISNTTPLPAKVYGGEGIAQLLFFEGDEEPEIAYADRKGKYMNQQGVTLPKM